MRWQLQQAKARFSQLVKQTKTDGVQEITVHGITEAVLMDYGDYRDLVEEKPSFIEFLMQSPLKDVDLDLERDQSPVRETEL